MNEQVTKALDSFQKHWDGKANAQWKRIFERAHAIFIAAGCEWDFCLQSASDSVVFGGSNRLIWDKGSNEFRASDAHCSDSFIQHVAPLLLIPMRHWK